MAHVVKFRSLLPDALQYAELGLRVVPLHSLTAFGKCPSCTCGHKSACDAAGKHPRFQGWVKKASTDADQVRQWWHDWQRSNVGIVTGFESGIVCLDIDPQHGGEETLTALIAKNEPIPPTWEARTGSGGRHLIFRHPGHGLKIGNTQNNKPEKKLGEGLDIRGDGGQFVAPPSTHKSGKRYEWINEPWNTPLADLPQWLFLMLVKPGGSSGSFSSGKVVVTVASKQRHGLQRYAAAALEKELKILGACGEGGRNNQLNDSAFSLGQLVGAGWLDRNTVYDALKSTADNIGLSDDETLATIESGLNAGQALPRAEPAGRNRQAKVTVSVGSSSATLAVTAATAASANGILPETEEYPDEANHSPHRLARLFLQKKCLHQDGSILRFYRDEWYCNEKKDYKLLPLGDLQAELNSFIHDAFMSDWRDGDGLWIGTGDSRERKVRLVTGQLISNTIQSLSGLVFLPEQTEFPSTIGEPEAHKNLISMDNGIVDVDALLSGSEPWIKPHTPLWFSPVSFDYPYPRDTLPVCTHWHEFLKRNLENDPERINLLQEWFGYCLLPDTSQQKFLIMSGEGSNGKSVICAVLTALVGQANVSAVPLELFGQRFQLTTTLGKLVNIAAEIGELDKAAEGSLKSFVSGDLMLFDRKNLQPVVARPTARLMLATNNLPRFSDKSSGIWRRMLYLPMDVIIPESEKKLGMDKAEWWLGSGEMPGIFSWALLGLARLRGRGRFTEPTKCKDGIENYKKESNPARMFLLDHYEEMQPSDQQKEHVPIICSNMYRLYKEWCKDNGYQALSDASFGKEVRRAFKGSLKDRMEMTPDLTGLEKTERLYVYSGIIQKKS